MGNRLVPESFAAASCPEIDPDEAPDFLHDESRLAANGVRAIARPVDAAQVAGAFNEARRRGEKVVISGGRTGIAGGAVPVDAGLVLSLAGPRRVRTMGRDAEGACYIRVEPGATLAEIAAFLARRGPGHGPVPADRDGPGGDAPALTPVTGAESEFTRRYRAGDADLPELWLPVDPTEATAHVGGAAAANASGARSFRYGPMRDWIRALAVVLPDGRLLRLRRGQVVADADGVLRLAPADGNGNDNDGGGDKIFRLPRAATPACKHSLGYAAGESGDALDLFVGQEGTLGAIVELELLLLPAPAALLGLTCVLPDEAGALSLCRAVREYFGAGRAAGGAAAAGVDGVVLTAVEYFSPEALALLRARRGEDPADDSIPRLPREEGAAVHLEFAVEDPAADHAEAEEKLLAVMEPLEEWLSAAGGDLDATWAATDAAELARQKAFRHAVPEAVNAEIGRRALALPGLHKVGTDMAVPDAVLPALLAEYRRGLAAEGLAAVLFGHLGDNHLHVNILPRSLDELARAKALYERWADFVVSAGGAVAAEHGIGRLKKNLFARQLSAAELSAWRAVRRAFDPDARLGPGVLFD